MATRRPNPECKIVREGDHWAVYLDNTRTGSISSTSLTYESPRDSTHFYRNAQSFGLSRAVFNRLMGFGVKYVRIDYKDATIRYFSDLADWSPLSGKIVFLAEHGYDPQYHLPVRFMKRLEG